MDANIILPIRGSNALFAYKMDCISHELKKFDKRAVLEIEYNKELTTIEVNKAAIYVMIKLLASQQKENKRGIK
jgi:hypothetical protein